MTEYFGVNLEFDHDEFYRKIEKAIKNKSAYVCVVDANVLTIANRDAGYRKILNQSLVNTCDGSSIAFLLSKIHKKNFIALNGPTIFKKLIEEDKKQVLLGGDAQSARSVQKKLQEENTANSTLHLMPLPFSEVEDFDYEKIAMDLNTLKPDIIWVSLGAPKQERFMHNLLPYLSSGVMFGIGAAFNFYIGKIKMPTYSIGGVGSLWLSRIFTEPKKQIKRILPYIMIIPKLYYSEKKKVNKANN